MARHQLARLSLQRAHTAPRAVLRAAALLSWLTQHAAVALGARCLWLDLSHHTQHDVDRASLDSLLSALPRLRGVTLLGAVDGTDAYEPLARLRSLSALELAGASQACLDGGLLALSFTPSLRALRVALDIAPASPLLLGELPLGLHSLSLAGMWLEELPRQLTALTGADNMWHTWQRGSGLDGTCGTPGSAAVAWMAHGQGWHRAAAGSSTDVVARRSSCPCHSWLVHSMAHSSTTGTPSLPLTRALPIRAQA